MENRIFDVVIVGGGITGTALAYVLAKYTNVKSIAVLEKYGSLAPLNSNARSNSQTLHCGDIETNYTLEKAICVKRTANMLVKYAEQAPYTRGVDGASDLKEIFDGISQEYEACAVFGLKTPEKAVNDAAKRAKMIMEWNRSR